MVNSIGKADILVHAHLMEHIYDLHEIIRTNRDALPVGGKMIFAIPNLKEFVKKKYTQGLCFEHNDENKRIFNEFIEYQKNIVKELNEKIDKEEKRPIYLFGAHVFSQYLIKFGLHTDKIRFVLDNAEIKQNKRLYGTNLETRSPRILAEEKNPIVILKVSQYRDEIANDIIQNINEHTEFWE